MERLQKILSQAGVASRRASEQLMLDGRVSVNGNTVRELGTKADPERDDIRVDGRRIKGTERRRYILLNKPAGYVTTRSDPQKRPTVIDLLAGVREYLYPVRPPRFRFRGAAGPDERRRPRRASDASAPRGPARLRGARAGIPDRHDLERLSRRMVIDGRRTGRADVTLVGERGGTGTLRITIREGRNRQVRKMCEAIGHPVERLTRIAIGPIRDTRLRPGQWRDLTAAEIDALRRGVERPPPTSRAARPRSPRA